MHDESITWLMLRLDNALDDVVTWSWDDRRYMCLVDMILILLCYESLSVVGYSIFQRDGRSLLLMKSLLHSFSTTFFRWTDEPGIAGVIIRVHPLRRRWVLAWDLSQLDQQVVVVDLLYFLWRDTVILLMVLMLVMLANHFTSRHRESRARWLFQSMTSSDLGLSWDILSQSFSLVEEEVLIILIRLVLLLL